MRHSMENKTIRQRDLLDARVKTLTKFSISLIPCLFIATTDITYCLFGIKLEITADSSLALTRFFSRESPKTS